MGIDAGADQLVPAQIKGVNGTGFLTNIIQVAAGDMHSMALAANGNVFAWGIMTIINWAMAFLVLAGLNHIQH